MGEVYGGYGSDPALVADVAQIKANMPVPATAPPPAVAVNSSVGTLDRRYATADHTHQSRLQARRIQVTPDANGRYVYTFPLAYEAGVIPILNVTAETPSAVSYRNDATILQGSTTETQTTIIITRLAQSQTVSILGAVLSLFQPVTTPVWINIMSRAPS